MNCYIEPEEIMKKAIAITSEIGIKTKICVVGVMLHTESKSFH